MSAFISLLLFFVYKAGVVILSYTALTYFNMRFDLITFYFYLFLSFFQFLFIFIQTLSKGSKKKRAAGTAQTSAIFQYTTVICLLMEIVILGMIIYYLNIQGNDLYNLFMILTTLTPLHTIFYYLHSILFGFIIKKRNVRIKSVGTFPLMLFILISFGEPIAYIVMKYFIKVKVNFLSILSFNTNVTVNKLDFLFFTFIMLVNGLVVFLLFFYKKIKAKKVYRLLANYSLLSGPGKIIVDEPNECGYIETGLIEFSEKLAKEKGNITLLNDYISMNIRSEIAKFGLKQEGEEKTAAVATIKFHLSQRDITPEHYIKMMNTIVTVIGEYADEYEAYPFFQLNKAVVVYGVPYYYEHEKYNAIEATQKTIGDIEKLIEGEGGEISLNAGIYSGSVIVGAYNTKGRDLREYGVAGSGIELSEKIALAAENIGVKLLVNDSMVENLKNKFYPERTFKIKMKNGEEIVVSQLKI